MKKRILEFIYLILFLLVFATYALGQESSIQIISGKQSQTPGNINGPTEICPGTTQVYSIAPVPLASGYSWTVSGNLTIISGQGTTSIELKALSNFNGGSVKVKSMGCSGNSGARTLKISKNVNCRVSIVSETTKKENILELFSAFPNPTSGKLTVVLQTKNKSKVQLKLVDMIGNVLMREFVTADDMKNTKVLNMHNISKGMYFLVAEINEVEIQSLKIVVE